MKNMKKNGILLLLFLLASGLVIGSGFLLWNDNKYSCCHTNNCKHKNKDNMQGFQTNDLEEITTKLIHIMNTLNGMANELNQLKDWMVVQNDTLDRKTVVIGLVNLSGNLSILSTEINQLSSNAITYAGITVNPFYRQALSKIANDLGNQSIMLKNASTDLMSYSQWLEKEENMNEIPGHITRIQSNLSQLSIYLTQLTNQLTTTYQSKPMP